MGEERQHLELELETEAPRRPLDTKRLQIRRRRLSFCEKLQRSHSRVYHDESTQNELLALRDGLASLQTTLDDAEHRRLLRVDWAQRRRSLLVRITICLQNSSILLLLILVFHFLNVCLVKTYLPEIFWELRDMPHVQAPPSSGLSLPKRGFKIG